MDRRVLALTIITVVLVELGVILPIKMWARGKVASGEGGTITQSISQAFTQI
jgi:hypothetical protein